MTTHVTTHDVRRWVAVKTQGASRYLIGVQACMEDVYGALEARQTTTAFFQARAAVLKCLSIRSLCRHGELLEPNELDKTSFDPFAGLSDEEIEQGMRIVADPDVFASASRTSDWLGCLEHYVRETEVLLGFGERLPMLRSQEGFLALARIARQWDQAALALGLPTSLPAE